MAVVSLPVLSSAVRPAKQPRTRKEREGAMREVLRVVRRDREFLRSVTTADPLRKVLDDIFWLRFLEVKGSPGVLHHQRSPNRWPTISHPPSLCFRDLVMADIEALKLYLSYVRQSSKIWSTPLPELYDPQKVADYFSCRPHVLAFRITKVFFSFVSAAIRLQTSGRLKLSRHGGKRRENINNSKYYVGFLLKETLLDLGPTFIKVGQSLSTRPDIIGSEISEALSELHNKVPPFPRQIALKIIEEELQCPLDNIFSHISDEPVAAASFGQVYKGCTVDGTVVAIKVQRPNLRQSVMRDIYILRIGLSLLKKVAKRKNDPAVYADELGKGFVGELDYTIEAENASKFLEAHSKYPFMLVPKVFKQLTRKRVLTMEWVMGENPNELLSMSKGITSNNIQYSEGLKFKAKARLLDLVNKGVEASLVQLLETGLLHADPHPGNLCYTPDMRLGFLDFGLICLMEKKHQIAMLASIVHIVNRDWTALVYDLTEMDVVPRGTNLRRVSMDLEGALGETILTDEIPEIKFSKVLSKIWSVALKYHFRMPPYYMLVLRSLASLEGLAMAADKNFKTFQAAYPYVVRKLLYCNSLATRRILYSIVFNRKNQLQWRKIVLFLKLCSIRIDVNAPNKLETSKLSGQGRNAGANLYQIANYILRLLPSRDGIVIRRLLMTADGASLGEAMISKDAASFRQLVIRTLGDYIFQQMVKAVAGFEAGRQLELHFVEAIEGKHEGEMGLSSVAPSVPMLQDVFQDQRLRIVFYKLLKDVRRNPILMFKVGWSWFLIFAAATTVGFHRFLVYLSHVYLSPPRLISSST